MTEEITWYDIILNNWSQIAVILGVIGYIIQRITEWNLKKNEISFSKIQENKILEIKAFYKSYQGLLNALKHFLDQTEFGIHSPEIFNKIRDEIRTGSIAFEYSCMTAKLFIEKSEISTIDKISSICEATRVDIERWHIYNESQRQPEDWDRLDEIRKIRFAKTLPDLIKRIEISLRKSYNIE